MKYQSVIQNWLLTIYQLSGDFGQEGKRKYVAMNFFSQHHNFLIGKIGWAEIDFHSFIYRHSLPFLSVVQEFLAFGKRKVKMFLHTKSSTFSIEYILTSESRQ